MLNKENLTGGFNNIIPATFQESLTYLEQLLEMRDKINEMIEVLNAIIEGGGSGYVLPIASTEKLGGIKIGENLTISEDGTLNAQAGGGVIEAKVEQTEDGARIVITDTEGTTEAEVKNGAEGPIGPTGPQGPIGETGPQGEAGAEGFSPIAIVEQTEDGAKITITDKTGTTEAEVKNGSNADLDLGNGLIFTEDGKLALNLGQNLYFTEDGKVNAVKGETQVITTGIADDLSIAKVSQTENSFSETVSKINDSITFTRF